MFAITHAAQSAEFHLQHELAFVHHQLAHGVARFDPDAQLAAEASLARLAVLVEQLGGVIVAQVNAMLRTCNDDQLAAHGYAPTADDLPF